MGALFFPSCKPLLSLLEYYRHVRATVPRAQWLPEGGPGFSFPGTSLSKGPRSSSCFSLSKSKAGLSPTYSCPSSTTQDWEAMRKVNGLGLVPLKEWAFNLYKSLHNGSVGSLPESMATSVLFLLTQGPDFLGMAGRTDTDTWKLTVGLFLTLESSASWFQMGWQTSHLPPPQSPGAPGTWQA